MGFKDARKQVIDCLKSGSIRHESRNNIDIKNLLATGEVDAEQVAAILGQAKGNEHQSSPHHCDAGIEVHIVKTKHSGRNWYIKWYFVDPNSVFISVHETQIYEDFKSWR
jgi:hypothetical protein